MPRTPLRTMVKIVADFVMEAVVTAKVDLEPHEWSAEQTTHRKRFRDRRGDTRLGTLSLKAPELRKGGQVPSLIKHCKRSEKVLGEKLRQFRERLLVESRCLGCVRCMRR